jgi:hypothetical protein
MNKTQNYGFWDGGLIPPEGTIFFTIQAKIRIFVKISFLKNGCN